MYPRYTKQQTYYIRNDSPSGFHVQVSVKDLLRARATLGYHNIRNTLVSTVERLQLLYSIAHTAVRMHAQ